LVEKKYIKLTDDQETLRVERKAISDDQTKVGNEIDKLENARDYQSPKVATPPIKKRTQYTKLAMFDNVMKSVDNGDEFFGWINGHIQNGRTTPSDKITGMVQNYDMEMPRTMQKQLGVTPHMAYFDSGKPIVDADGKNVLWNMDLAKQETYYNDLSDGKWYWRVDYTPALKRKIKNSKIEMYGVGGVSLLAATQGENDENE